LKPIPIFKLYVAITSKDLNMATWFKQLSQQHFTHLFIRVMVFAIIYFIALWYLIKYSGSWDVLRVILIFGAIFITYGIVLLVEALLLHKNKAILKRNINLVLIPICILIIAITLGW
jgi:hypothetical protein